METKKVHFNHVDNFTEKLALEHSTLNRTQFKAVFEGQEPKWSNVVAAIQKAAKELAEKYGCRLQDASTQQLPTVNNKKSNILFSIIFHEGNHFEACDKLNNLYFLMEHGWKSKQE